MNYRQYLQSDHWKDLRGQALERDGHTCQKCGSLSRLQVHHLRYRAAWFDSQIGDLQTVCRKCHRLEHGIGPTEFAEKAREMEVLFNHQKRPAAADWTDLKSLIKTTDDLLYFGEIMFKFIMYVLAHHREPANWWLNPERKDYWFDLAFRIRRGIYERTIDDLTTKSLPAALR